jgi:hypothetical protein
MLSSATSATMVIGVLDHGHDRRNRSRYFVGFNRAFEFWPTTGEIRGQIRAVGDSGRD